VNRIRDYRFGHVMVDEQAFDFDLIVLPARVVPNWWRKEGHSLCMDDLSDVLEELPAHLVVGSGHDARMQPQPDALRALEARGIDVEVLPTQAAIRRFGELDPATTAAALHLTC
jgi:hypothetical protein